MNTFADATTPDGPLVTVAVTLSQAATRALRLAGRPLPQPVELVALIDTGADVTVIDPAGLAPLLPFGLQPDRYLFVNAPGLGPLAPVPVYSVGLELPAGTPAPLRIPTLPVAERAIGAGAYQLLLGRDVLARCVVLLDGPGRRFTLAY